MSQKSQLRKHFKALRSAIPKIEREKAAIAAAKHFAASALFKRSEHIACYLATDAEFDASPIIENIWHAQKHCYLPVLTDKKTLLFVRYRYGDTLHHNRYSILEPKDKKHLIPASQLDVVMVPLIAFDKNGHRIGTGGGYYDRTFAFLHEDKTITKPQLLGLAYALQEADALPEDDWDIKLSMIVTEKEIITI